MAQSASVRRIQRELKEVQESSSRDFEAHPVDDNLFEWHFTFRGQEDSDFRGGLYHGRIQFPADYPMKPPSFFMVTPSGRFEVDQRLCLSNSDFHPESWQPSWSGMFEALHHNVAPIHMNSLHSLTKLCYFLL
jgi:ubiquitin-conjugating enzyme E2 J1